MLNISDWMGEFRTRLDQRLTHYLSEKMEEAEKIGGNAAELCEGVQSLTLRGGKRFRPMMVEAAYRAVRPDGEADATLNLGAALEVLQSFLLIHDDWMDQDAERRGGPSIHMMYRARHANEHDADSLAILAGDLGAAYSLELLLRAPFAADDLKAGLALFLQIQKEVFFGQHLDITANADVARMHDLKTTSYTVRGPILLGATLAGADDAQLAMLRAYANPLGSAFQLADDLLGTFGDMATTGKPGNDLRNGKRTALVGEAEKRLPAGERDALDAVMRGETSPENVRAAADLLIFSGAKAAVEVRLKSQADEAKAALGSGLDDSAKALLVGLADKLALRSV